MLTLSSFSAAWTVVSTQFLLMDTQVGSLVFHGNVTVVSNLVVRPYYDRGVSL